VSYIEQALFEKGFVHLFGVFLVLLKSKLGEMVHRCRHQIYLLCSLTISDISISITFSNLDAKLIETVLLPTPPLQLLTATMFWTFWSVPLLFILFSTSFYYGASLIDTCCSHSNYFNSLIINYLIFTKFFSSLIRIFKLSYESRYRSTMYFLSLDDKI